MLPPCLSIPAERSEQVYAATGGNTAARGQENYNRELLPVRYQNAKRARAPALSCFQRPVMQVSLVYGRP